MKRSYLSSEYQRSRSYSPAVITEGGRTIWLAGHLAAEDEDDEHHAFALKYRLFESGRWPIGVVGNSFHIF